MKVEDLLDKRTVDCPECEKKLPRWGSWFPTGASNTRAAATTRDSNAREDEHTRTAHIVMDTSMWGFAFPRDYECERPEPKA
jgi:hypothetical protein